MNKENIYDICELKHLRNKNSYRVIIGQSDINSKRNEFESFVNNNRDILVVSEAKKADTFPESQFLIDGFSAPYRLGCTANGGLNMALHKR